MALINPVPAADGHLAAKELDIYLMIWLDQKIPKVLVNRHYIVRPLWVDVNRESNSVTAGNTGEKPTIKKRCFNEERLFPPTG